jgi:putative ABC transport system substrate-binding protein
VNQISIKLLVTSANPITAAKSTTYFQNNTLSTGRQANGPVPATIDLDSLPNKIATSQQTGRNKNAAEQRHLGRPGGRHLTFCPTPNEEHFTISVTMLSGLDLSTLSTSASTTQPAISGDRFGAGCAVTSILTSGQRSRCRVLVQAEREATLRAPPAQKLMDPMMHRRQLVLSTLAAVTAPSMAMAQSEPGRLRRVGVMMAIGENDPEGVLRIGEFRRSFELAGWVEGRNTTIEVGWYKGSHQIALSIARGFIDRGVDVIVVNGTPGLEAVRSLGTSIPVVFVVVSNPVGAGYVSSLSRPGANTTGFSTFEPEISGKWLQLLRQAVPGLKNVNMLIDEKAVGLRSLWLALAEIAPQHGINAHPAFASTWQDIERALLAISSQEAPGLIVTPSPINTVNRVQLIALANKSRIPAIYPFRFYVRDGALLAYGFNAADQFRRAATYVGRILAGENPGDLPVQPPSLFELGINLKTAKAMGIDAPQSLIIAADEVVE